MILDEDGVHDPASFNGWLLLGLKVTMSEADCTCSRPDRGAESSTRCDVGNIAVPCPRAFVYDEAGSVVLDPDARIRETIAYFFETFSRVGSAWQMVKVFRKEWLLCPSRLRVGDTISFRPLTTWTALRMPNNPRYAGAYGYGRR